MDHLAKPLEALNAASGAFVGDASARILHVTVDPALAEPATQIVLGQEWHPENRRGFFLLTAPYAAKTPGWLERVRALRAEYERHQGAFDEQAVTLPPLPALDEAKDPLITFAYAVKLVADAFKSDSIGTEGVVVLLAPGQVEAAPELARELRELANTPSLAPVRWVWIHPTPGSDVDPKVMKALGDRVLRCPCHVDPQREKAEADDLLAGIATAIASGGGLPGGARPKVAPPPHPGDPPSIPAAEGASPHAFLLPFIKAIQRLRSDDAQGATGFLRSARDLCLQTQQLPAAIEMELLLATTLAQLGLARKAGVGESVPVFATAVGRAQGAGLLALAARSALVLGLFANLGKDLGLAGRSLMRAAGFARDAGVPLIEFQALRLAGELGIKAGARERGAERIKDALDVAATVPPAEAGAIGLKDGAVDLVAFCKKNGLDALAKQAEAALAKEA